MTQRNPLFTRTLLATATVNPSRFVQLAGTQSGSGAYALGVSWFGYSALPGQSPYIPVTVLGSEIVETGGAFAVGDLIQSDASGRAIVYASGKAVGRAVEASSGSGKFVEVLLLQN